MNSVNLETLRSDLGLSDSRVQDIQSRLDAPRKGIERTGLHGHLRILGVSKDRTWVICDDHNLVTNVGYFVMSSLWGGPTAPETYDTMRPRRIGIGTGTEASPTVTMTRLKMSGTPYTQLPTYIANTDQSVLISQSGAVRGVRLEMLVPNGDGLSPYNGVTLTEAGLFTASYNGGNTGAGGMIAYKTYPSITKTDQFSLLYQWQFIWSAA